MMMNAIIETNWAGSSGQFNSSFLEPRSPFLEEMSYGTPVLSPESKGCCGGDAELIPSNFTKHGFDNGSGDNLVGPYSGAPLPFPPFGDEESEYIFDRSDVRAIFLVLYTIVFCSCFFGNLMVILVVTLHWRMRSITNFCLANLAFADLCVGIFCVYQNIVTYLMDSWVFGEFMCKMFHFINSLSTTASVLILVVICIERYLAIIHPMTCKQMLTLNRLRITIVFVWILSAAISSPRLYYFSTRTFPLPNDQVEILCLPNRLKYDSKLMDMISMTVLYLIPLAIISILYTQIGIVLWKSSNSNMQAATPSVESSTSSGCYYRETDQNLIQTVNLTLIPISDQQGQTVQNGRPSTLASPHPHRQISSASAGSFLPSPFICLQCKEKKKLKRKSTRRKQTCRFVNGNGIPGKKENQENSIDCKVCQYPFSHLHYSNEPVETSFSNPPQNLTKSGSCSTLPPEPCIARKDAKNSPVSTCLCIRKPEGKQCHCLRRQSSLEEKEGNAPPSPFCSRSCPCLEKQEQSSKQDPIVLVKFDSKKKTRNHCVLMMNLRKKGNSEENKKENGGIPEECTEEVVPAQTSSSSPPRLDCAICHPPGGNSVGVLHSIIDCEENSNSSVGEVPSNPVIIGNGLRANHSHPHCCKNFMLFERNTSVDSGISSIRCPALPSQPCCCSRGRVSDQNFDCYSINNGGCGGNGGTLGTCIASCPSCGATCGESFDYNSSSSPPKIGVPTSVTSTAPPKRLRRMRIIRSSKYGSGALQSRRRIIRMLIVVVLAFALCHLPFHARKIWQYWSPAWAQYHGGSVFSTLFTPITFLIMYANSGINPILYAFMSKKFRMSFKDLLCCKMRHSLRIQRNASVRSTHAVALSQAGGL